MQLKINNEIIMDERIDISSTDSIFDATMLFYNKTKKSDIYNDSFRKNLLIFYKFYKDNIDSFQFKVFNTLFLTNSVSYLNDNNFISFLKTNKDKSLVNVLYFKYENKFLYNYIINDDSLFESISITDFPKHIYNQSSIDNIDALDNNLLENVLEIRNNLKDGLKDTEKAYLYFL